MLVTRAVRSDLRSFAPRRRAVRLAVAVVATAGLGLSACSADEAPNTPAISGEDPGEVTVPTVPPTTTTVPTVSTDVGSATGESGCMSSVSSRRPTSCPSMPTVTNGQYSRHQALCRPLPKVQDRLSWKFHRLATRKAMVE